MSTVRVRLRRLANTGEYEDQLKEIGGGGRAKTQARPLELGINRITKPKEIPLFDCGGTAHPGKRTRRAQYRELYKYALKPLIRVFGKKMVCDNPPDDIRAYQTRRLSTGVSARTVNIEVGALRTVLKAHRLWGPISDAIEMLRERKDVGRALDYEDERKLIAAAGRSRSPVLLPLLTITLDTGCAPGRFDRCVARTLVSFGGMVLLKVDSSPFQNRKQRQEQGGPFL